MSKFRQQYLDSVALPVTLVIAILAVIATIGNIFIGAYQGGEKDRIDRPELWIGIGILVGVIVIMSLLSRMPENKGLLAKDVVIGDVGIWDHDLPPVDPRATMGPLGNVADITPGYKLDAQSGELAIVQGVLPGGVDYGRKFSGMLYGTGVKSAAKEMWIPFEAVTSVYPESKTAFLAIRGDETEALGWTVPPEGMVRGEKHQSAADKVK